MSEMKTKSDIEKAINKVAKLEPRVKSLDDMVSLIFAMNRDAVSQQCKINNLEGDIAHLKDVISSSRPETKQAEQLSKLLLEDADGPLTICSPLHSSRVYSSFAAINESTGAKYVISASMKELK